MSVTITAAGLVEAFPEWEYANTNTPAVVASAISVANAKHYESVYTDEDEETYRRHLEASAILFTKPFARDMRNPENGSRNPYRVEAEAMDRIKGSAFRCDWGVS